MRKSKRIRFRGTLPLINWLSKNEPEFAPSVIRAIREASRTSDEPDLAALPRREMRPTVGELMTAATDAFRNYVKGGKRHEGKGARIEGGSYFWEPSWFHLGDLVFFRGKLIQWGATRSGRKLFPMEQIRGAGGKRQARNTDRYLATKATAPSPLTATTLPRPMRTDSELIPMYDPLPRKEPADRDPHGCFGVEEGRALLRQLEEAGGLPPVTKCPPAIARGAYFFGGVSAPSGNAAKGTIGAWDAPEPRSGEAQIVLDEIAARGTLKSLGVRLGYADGYADRAAKRVLVDTAKMLAANDNHKEKQDRAA